MPTKKEIELEADEILAEFCEFEISSIVVHPNGEVHTQYLNSPAWSYIARTLAYALAEERLE